MLGFSIFATRCFFIMTYFPFSLKGTKMQLAVRSFLDITALLGLLSIVVPRGRLTNLFVLPLRKSLYWK